MKAKENIETKKLILKIIILSIFGIGLALVFANPNYFKICSQSYEWGGVVGCLDDYTEGASQSFLSFSLMSIFFSTILLFLHESVFRSWFKFARIYIPLALIFIFLSALSPGGGSWGVSNNFDGEAATWFFSGLFLLISLILIFYKSRKLKKSSG